MAFFVLWIGFFLTLAVQKQRATAIVLGIITAMILAVWATTVAVLAMTGTEVPGLAGFSQWLERVSYALMLFVAAVNLVFVLLNLRTLRSLKQEQSLST